MSKKFAVREKYIDSGRREIRFREYVENIEGDIHEVMRQGWFLYLEALRKRANKAILKKDKRGKVYRVKSRSSGAYRNHRSSRSPQSHANMFGDLRRSLSWKTMGWNKGRFGYGVSSNAKGKAPKYATWVEGGTRRMRPRPSLHNSFNREDVEKHWDKAFDRVFR